MIRLILIWNALLTVLIAMLLVVHLHDRLHKVPIQASSTQADVIRVRRVEVVDQEGRVTAELGETLDGSAAGLSLFDANGRRAVTLALNDRGYGALYFQSRQSYAKVSVGYFSGSDQKPPPLEEDPGGIWGIRVSRPNLEPPQVFGVLDDGRPIPTSP